MIQYREDMHFDSSLMELPESSSALPSELQRPICMHSSMPSNNKIQQDEDERDPKFMQLLKENLSCFWNQQKEEILRAGVFWLLTRVHLQRPLIYSNHE